MRDAVLPSGEPPHTSAREALTPFTAMNQSNHHALPHARTSPSPTRIRAPALPGSASSDWANEVADLRHPLQQAKMYTDSQKDEERSSPFAPALPETVEMPSYTQYEGEAYPLPSATMGDMTDAMTSEQYYSIAGAPRAPMPTKRIDKSMRDASETSTYYEGNVPKDADTKTKNRIAAKRSREKKKLQMKLVEDRFHAQKMEMARLTAETDYLLHYIQRLKGALLDHTVSFPSMIQA